MKIGQTRPLFENLWNFFKKFENFSEASEKFLESKNFFIKNIFIKKFLKNFFKLFKKIFKKNYFYKKIYKKENIFDEHDKKNFRSLALLIPRDEIVWENLLPAKRCGMDRESIKIVHSSSREKQTFIQHLICDV